MRRTITITYDDKEVEPSSMIEQVMQVIEADRYLSVNVLHISYVANGVRHTIRRCYKDEQLFWSTAQ